MKRRRLHRYSNRVPFNPRAMREDVVPLRPEPSREQIMFERGIEHGMMLAHRAQAANMAEVQRRALQAAQSEPYLILARQNGYSEGYQAGLRKSGGSPSGNPDAQFTYSDLERARQRGFEDGKRAGGIPDTGASRKKVLDEVMQEVRVISESNPNLNPSAFNNALKHRLKKLY